MTELEKKYKKSNSENEENVFKKWSVTIETT